MSQLGRTSSVTRDCHDKPLAERPRKQQKLDQILDVAEPHESYEQRDMGEVNTQDMQPVAPCLVDHDYCGNLLCSQPPVTKVYAECQLPAARVGIDKLPDEILLRILSYSSLKELTKVMQNVCSRWRRVSHDPVLWRNKKFFVNRLCSDDEAEAMLQQMPQLHSLNVTRAVRSSVIHALCDCCSRLDTLQFCDSQKISFPLLNKLVEKCQNIQVLFIPHHLLCDSRKAQTLSQLNRLRTLVLEVQYSTRRKLIHLRPVADGCRQLAAFQVTDMVHVKMQDLKYFFEVNCGTLRLVTLPWAVYTPNGLRSPVPPLKVCTSLIELQLVLYTLCEVNLRGSDVHQSFVALGHLSNLRLLTMIGLQNSPRGSSALAFKSGGLSQLQALYLCNNADEDSTVAAVCEHCPELRILSLKGCSVTDEALRQAHRLTKLEVLDLWECKYLRGEALSHVAQVTNLRKLLLGDLNAKHLTPGLERILDITSLETLSFVMMPNINIFPFNKIPGNLVNLRALELGDVELDCNVLDQLQEQMPDLKVSRK